MKVLCSGKSGCVQAGVCNASGGDLVAFPYGMVIIQPQYHADISNVEENSDMQTQIGTQEITLAKARQEASTIFLAKVFNWMAIGLGITGIIAYVFAESGMVRALVASPIFFILILAELGLVFFLSARIEKIQPVTATGLFIGYSILNGVTLSTIFLAYTQASIATTFLVTAGMFAAMAVYGMVTKRDLSGVGSFMFMGLIGILLASIVNIFLKSSALYWAISAIGVLVFVGLTAYDVQKIKNMGEEGIMQQGEGAIRKGAIIGALALYLDFINLFLMLLRFFGGSRD
jgi:FtsH-binding integral membrane protein